MRLPLGRRILANKPGEPIGMPMNLLEKHTLVLAGAGSGKTVLLKRLIEESLILGIPSIVIDCANDLATLDEEWSPHPAEWEDEDRKKAEQYHRKRQVIIWTPGKEAGNPLSFEPLPDLAPLSHDEDELDTAVSMVCRIAHPGCSAWSITSLPAEAGYSLKITPLPRPARGRSAYRVDRTAGGSAAGSWFRRGKRVEARPSDRRCPEG